MKDGGDDEEELGIEMLLHPFLLLEYVLSQGKPVFQDIFDDLGEFLLIKRFIDFQ